MKHDEFERVVLAIPAETLDICCLNQMWTGCLLQQAWSLSLGSSPLWAFLSDPFQLQDGDGRQMLRLRGNLGVIALRLLAPKAPAYRICLHAMRLCLTPGGMADGHAPLLFFALPTYTLPQS